VKIDNFFAELKRRNIYKVAVAYAVVAWLLVQVTTQVFPIFEIPNWALRLIVLAIIVGFPIALVMAWAFELTPEGLKRTEDVDPFDSRSGQILAAQTRAKSHAWIFVVIIAGAMSLGLFFLGRFTAPRKQGGANEVSSKSIAVLPFVNLSSDKEQEFFSDGLSEELLNQLAQVPQLRVIARTSSFSFKGKEVELNRRSRWPRTWLWATAVADTFAILAPGIGKVRQRISNELWRWIPTTPSCCPPTPRVCSSVDDRLKQSPWLARRP
jgi:hypothetical protein